MERFHIVDNYRLEAQPLGCGGAGVCYKAFGNNDNVYCLKIYEYDEGFCLDMEDEV